ncbi:MAG: ABC transporter substrate-binding protein [Halobacteriaceae archaeon]
MRAPDEADGSDPGAGAAGGADRPPAATRDSPGLSRRSVLGAAAGLATGATAGCVQRVQSLVSRREPERLSISIKVVPADSDPVASRIARRLSKRLEAVGVDTSREPMAESELRRDVLVDHDFDVYVGRYPGHHDPDFLRSLLHTVYLNDRGWLNPFGFTDLELSDLLDQQRDLVGGAREVAVADVQREVARQQPFTVLAVPDDVAAMRRDRYVGAGRYGLGTPLRFLGLERTGGEPTFGVALTDGSITRNLNPIAIAEGDRRPFMGLLYESLGRHVEGRVRPWLATDWSFDLDGDRTAATVTLRDGLTWHDGTALTVDDVLFTYRFLADTSLGRRDTPAPAPPYQGQVSLVHDVERTGANALRFTFTGTGPAVCRRALTVPVLPEHVWAEKTGPAGFAGVDVVDDATEALVWSNIEPVGSGPLRFGSVVPDASLTLERFDDHFLVDAADDLPTRFGGGVDFEEFVVQVAPSDAAVVQLAAAGDVDATAGTLSPTVVPRVGREPDLQLLIDRSRAFYHVGYNVRRSPFGNPHFRRIVASLLDKERVVEELFDGYASPAATPLATTSWVPPDLEWSGADPEVPFRGTDGTLDVAAVRQALRDAGYEFGADGRLHAP